MCIRDSYLSVAAIGGFVVLFWTISLVLLNRGTGIRA